MTIEELAAFAENFKMDLLNYYRFDNVNRPYVTFNSDGISLQYCCYEKWSKHSDSLTVSVHIPLHESNQAPEYKVEPHWRRELRYLAKQSANIIEHQDAFATEAGKRFVADMVSKRDEIAGLLTED